LLLSRNRNPRQPSDASVAVRLSLLFCCKYQQKQPALPIAANAPVALNRLETAT